jgi:hypothetical protein
MGAAKFLQIMVQSIFVKRRCNVGKGGLSR